MRAGQVDSFAASISKITRIRHVAPERPSRLAASRRVGTLRSRHTSSVHRIVPPNYGRGSEKRERSSRKDRKRQNRSAFHAIDSLIKPGAGRNAPGGSIPRFAQPAPTRLFCWKTDAMAARPASIEPCTLQIREKSAVGCRRGPV